MQFQKNSDLKAVDFFCSGGGMTNGFRKAGITVLGGIDIDSECELTYSTNNPGSLFIHSDIKKLKFRQLEEILNIRRNDDSMIFIGCSPCQYWSKIKTIKEKSEESKNLLMDFQRFVKHFKPGFVVIENVPGILNRIQESPLQSFLSFLDDSGYAHNSAIINSCHYGVPQTRKRFLLIASRVKTTIKLPIPDTTIRKPTVRDFIGNLTLFRPIPSGYLDGTSFMHSTSKLTEKNLIRISITAKNGGSRMGYANDEKIAIPSQLNNNNFSDSYSRMFWDKPAPTITTRFNSLSNGRFGHPEQDRAISLREGATLQTFDLDYLFLGKNQQINARLIGNAVPPILASKIAESIRSHE